ncbi:hypothetical protein [Pelomonas cellulosilytica]|uniref:Uncharacterized protein n=1 Tax=Pelomonas cellulosilytica TaxID=2906762 RepID=A0ABS8XLT4_9BURK|nr:hypothetical protein [Pelomonas sp. P8]MCE4553749.1 hypothetical protein [Pelomonas sp. P8]
MATQDDFDPARALDGWRPPAPAPLDLELGRLLDAGRATLDDAKKERLKARGYTLDDIEDVELPAVAPLPPVGEPPRLNLPAAPVPRSAQLLTSWQPQAWTALVRRVRGASAEVLQTANGPIVENHAPQWLCALWPPQRLDSPLLGRWPELATLMGAETACGALHQLLPQLPPRALLWPAELDVDWALIADIVLHQDARLRPAQALALRELAEAERGKSFARLNDGYALRDRVARRRA